MAGASAKICDLGHTFALPPYSTASFAPRRCAPSLFDEKGRPEGQPFAGRQLPLLLEDLDCAGRAQTDDVGQADFRVLDLALASFSAE